MESAYNRKGDRRSLIEKRCEIRRITTRRTGFRRLELIEVEMDRRIFQARRQANRRLEARRVEIRRCAIDRRQDPKRFPVFFSGSSAPVPQN